MPTLTQLADLESLALNALKKVLTTTNNPTLITKAASIILRFCAQLRKQNSPSQREWPGVGNMNPHTIDFSTHNSPSQREGAGGRAMSSKVIKVSTPGPSPNPFTNLLTKQEVIELRHLMPNEPMNQILNPTMVKHWRNELARTARTTIPDTPLPAPVHDPPRYDSPITHLKDDPC